MVLPDATETIRAKLPYSSRLSYELAANEQALWSRFRQPVCFQLLVELPFNSEAIDGPLEGGNLKRDTTRSNSHYHLQRANSQCIVETFARHALEQQLLIARCTSIPHLTQKDTDMTRAAAVTFKGTPLSLAGEEVQVGQQAPDFTVHYFDDGLHTITLADMSGKPTIISVVPSLDTGVCQIQTKRFNQELSALGDQVNAVTISLDLPFAMNRFCGAEDIKSMRVGSDYQDRNFGQNWGMLIEELKLLARGVFVLDAEGKVVYAETVGEVTDEPNYEPAMTALKGLLS